MAIAAPCRSLRPAWMWLAFPALLLAANGRSTLHAADGKEQLKVLQTLITVGDLPKGSRRVKSYASSSLAKADIDFRTAKGTSILATAVVNKRNIEYFERGFKDMSKNKEYSVTRLTLGNGGLIYSGKQRVGARVCHGQWRLQVRIDDKAGEFDANSRLALGRVLIYRMSSRFEKPGAGPGDKKQLTGLSPAARRARAGRLIKVIEKWQKATGTRVTYDTKTFWRRLGKKVSFQKLAGYVKLEDGAVKPIRTGREVALYDAIKKYVAGRKGGDTLGMDELLVLALQTATVENGTVNLQETLLTTHNVVRLLARPQQWSGGRITGDYGHPRTDPAYPILQDLLGKSSTGGKTMAQLRGTRRRADGSAVNPQWSTNLFDLRSGIFQPQPDAKNAVWNGGCHYYYWLGAMSQTVMGRATVIYGGAKELDAKEHHGRGVQGRVEISQLLAGADFGMEAFKRRNTVLKPKAPP